MATKRHKARKKEMVTGDSRHSPFCAFCVFSRPISSVPFRSRRRQRGTAEIELILIVTILITMLMLAMASMKIAAARMSVAGSASYKAFQNATAGATPQYTGDAPVTGFESVRPDPDLPSRVHEVSETVSVSNGDGNKGTIAVTVGSKAAIISPNWTYSSYPVGQNDQAVLEQWFTNYVDETHSGLSDSLGLAPEWTP